MVVRSVRLSMAVAILLVAARSGGAAVTAAEDLAGCTLPNGRVVLPVAGTAAGQNGCLFKFSKTAFSATPTAADGKNISPEDVLARVREARSADIQYLPENGGSLWALSGAIAEVPKAVYLSDLTGKKVAEPWPIPKTTQNLAGQCRDLRDGGVYILKTTDNHYVLLRILEKSASNMVIQFVYQPDGGTQFTMPINAPVAYQQPVDAAPETPSTRPADTAPAVVPVTVPAVTRPAGAATTRRLGPGEVNEPGIIRIVGRAPATAPTLSNEPSLDAFARQRAQMLQMRLGIIAAPARTDAEIERKAQAIAELAALHVDEQEVAEVLVSELTFLLPRNQIREISPEAMLPCYAALKRMGKPATLAALKGLKKLDLNAAGEGIDAVANKAKLLGMIVRSVEGNEVAELILRQEANRETDAKRKALYEGILAN